MKDIRFALRMLGKSPGFTAIAVLVLAMGIGGNSAMFSLVNALVLRPLVARDPEQLIGCYCKEKGAKGRYRAFSYPNYMDIRDQNTVFDSLLAFNVSLAGIEEGETTMRRFVGLVSANYFSTFGVRMALGRDFLPEEERPGWSTPAVIVSHQYWKRHGGGKGILGETLRVNGRPCTVVGVVPEHFTGTAALFSPELWLPLSSYDFAVEDFMNETKGRLEERSHASVMLVGRLKPGLTMPAAEAQLKALAARMEQAYPVANKDLTCELARLPRLGISTNPHNDTPQLAATAALLLSLSTAVLMIACLNLANMLLARATSRRKEIAIRLALGAGRWSIIRQLLIEGMMLSLLGAALGLVLACWATHVLVASLLPRVSMLLSINFTAMPGWRVLAATAGFCVLATLVFGLGPAFKLTRPDVVSDLKEQGGEDRQGKSRGILAPRNLVVLAQVALSLALVTTAGLFIRGAVKAASATPGYSLEGGVVAEVDPSLAGYAEAQGRQLYREIIERLSSVPGAESVSLSSCMPFGMFSFGCSVRNSDGSTPAGTNTTGEVPGVGAMLNIIGTDYFSTMGMPLLRGRKFDRIEVEATGLLQTAIVDEPLARRLWPGQDPLGKRLTIDGKKNGNEVAVLEVVGVVPGLRHSLFDQEPSAHVYVPFGQMYQSQMNINLKLARTGREAEAAFIQDIRRELKAIDPRLPLISLTTLASHRDSGIEMWLVSTGARLFTAFGLLALFLAVVGVYGVKAYLVSRRTREIGIRMALGADIADVLWMVLREGAVLTLVGLGAGLLLASAAGLLVRSMLYQVKALDPLVFCVAPILLAAAIMMACYIPARRAARIQPMSALRSE